MKGMLLPGVLGIFFFLFIFVSSVCAARNLSIEGNKASLFGEEEMTITASASGFTQGETIYIKGAFYKEGSTNYFSYTKKDDLWVKNGETATNQRPVVVGSWDNKLEVKSDFTDSGYQGEGDYKFKVGFYYITNSGSTSSINWSDNILSVVINEPSYTPTPVPTATPTSVPTPTKTPTPSPTPTKLPTITPTKVVTPGSSDGIESVPVQTADAEEDSGPTSVLGVTDTVKKPSPTPVVAQSTSRNYIPFILITLGIVFMAGFGILSYSQLQFWKKD